MSEQKLNEKQRRERLDATEAVARAIARHLNRFESDKTINAPRSTHGNLPPYYNAACYAQNYDRVSVTYVSYVGHSNITRAEADTYLAWLDAGNVGPHQMVIGGEFKRRAAVRAEKREKRSTAVVETTVTVPK